MAHMIPAIPKEFDEKSEEGLVFKALEKLSDDYYVFHSVSLSVVDNNTLYEREIDFVVANKERGVLCIEAKNGARIGYRDRCWVYGSGLPMEHGGPYNQIATAKRGLISKIRSHKDASVRSLYGKCKMMHAVFFIKLTQNDFDAIVKAGLPEDADPNITLLAEDLLDPTSKIEKIFNIKLPQEKYSEFGMNDREFRMLLESVLCPEFNLVPSPVAKNLATLEQMNQLLVEQYNLLNYLEYQAAAVINGAAGTGKTMIAVEKARRHSVNGEKVLFLCYNRMLCDKLTATHKKSSVKEHCEQFKNVDFMTIAQLVRAKTGDYKDYDGFIDWLLECLDKPALFEHKHIIIDEGQDFGLLEAALDKSSAEKNCDIINYLQEVVLRAEGTFYLFYDKNQMVQGGSKAEYFLPDCINDCDCRLTLFRNCRNTKEIAKTSVTPLKDKKNKAIKFSTACSWVDPIKPRMHIVSDCAIACAALDRILASYNEAGIEDVVLLTQGVLDYSFIAEKLSKDESNPMHTAYYYKFSGRRYPVTTCIKFKGLEADAIVLLDLKKDSFTERKGLEFYVGASRAKLRLDMICRLDENEYAEVVQSLDSNAPIKNDPARMRRILGSTFSCEIETEHH